MDGTLDAAALGDCVKPLGALVGTGSAGDVSVCVRRRHSLVSTAMIGRGLGGGGCVSQEDSPQCFDVEAWRAVRKVLLSRRVSGWR